MSLGAMYIMGTIFLQVGVLIIMLLFDDFFLCISFLKKGTTVHFHIFVLNLILLQFFILFSL